MGRAIVREPQVFCMDEPLSNLDAKLRVQTRTQIAALQRRLGTTTVYVTHDQVEAMTMGDRVAVLKNGKLQQFASPTELYNRPTNAFVAGFIGSPAMNLMTMPIVSDGVRSVNSTLALERDQLSALHAAGLETVTVGVRPEQLRVIRGRRHRGGHGPGRGPRQRDLRVHPHHRDVQLVARSLTRTPARLADTVALRKRRRRSPPVPPGDGGADRLTRPEDRGRAGIHATRQVRVDARPVGEDLMRHLPAVVVHRRLVARTVRHPVAWIGGGRRRPEDRRGYHHAGDHELCH